MTTNEVLFWALVILAWGLSLVVAYFYGRDHAFKAANRIIDRQINEILRRKLDELKNQPPIR